MNIFASSKCPKLSANFLDNSRVNKMILETAQILSTVLRLNGINDPRLYKITHKSHPSILWTNTSLGNFKWLVEHFRALGEVKLQRTGKGHATYARFESGLVFIDLVGQTTLKGELTPFSNNAANQSIGVSYKHLTDTTEAYRLYLRDRWAIDKRKPKWE
jgi:hypothetical protein